MRLPLTLAIIDGIVVRVGTERYVIPTLSVLESLRPTATEISTVLNRGEMISIRGQLLPLFRISRLFSIDDAEEDPTEALVVVVDDGERRTGLLVDDLIGHQQVVIKNLGGSIGNITGISGGAIMADGRVGLILDVAGIIRLTTGVGDMMAV
jgi:two-component system chemotaxis sensor kinase CheA